MWPGFPDYQKWEKKQESQVSSIYLFVFWLQMQCRQPLHGLPTVVDCTPLNCESRLTLPFLCWLFCFSNKKSNEDAQVEWWLAPDLGLGLQPSFAADCEALGRCLISICLSFFTYEIEKTIASPSSGLVIIQRINDICKKTGFCDIESLMYFSLGI